MFHLFWDSGEPLDVFEDLEVVAAGDDHLDSGDRNVLALQDVETLQLVQAVHGQDLGTKFIDILKSFI